jgi:uncharacterized OsmC-like protein
MGEQVIVRQDSQFETEILARDPHDSDDQTFHTIDNIYQLTPYGMLLSGLGSCTAIVIHTYAQYHDVALDTVKMHLTYDRVFADDCQECEGIDEYQEQIDITIAVSGALAPGDKRRLLAISKHCPIHKMLAHGIEVQTNLAEGDRLDV